MELIILGIVLFIVGVSCTFLYDHMKAQTTKSREYRTSRSTTPAPTSKKNPLSAPTYQADVYDQMIASVKARANRGETHMRVQGAGQKEQTMTVQELIARLERMKKDL